MGQAHWGLHLGLCLLSSVFFGTASSQCGVREVVWVGGFGMWLILPVSEQEAGTHEAGECVLLQAEA